MPGGKDKFNKGSSETTELLLAKKRLEPSQLISKVAGVKVKTIIFSKLRKFFPFQIRYLP